MPFGFDLPDFSSITNGVPFGETVKNFGAAVKDSINQATAPETQKQQGKRVSLQNSFDYNYVQYPLDLDSQLSRHPYYMTFYIATQDLSKYKRPPSKGPSPLSTADINARASRTLKNVNIKGTNVGFGRKTHRTSAAIRLYMPDTLSWNYSNQFSDVSISSQPLAQGAAIIAAIPALADSITAAWKAGSVSTLLSSLLSKKDREAAGIGAEVAEKAFGFSNGLLTSGLGIAVNPQIDVIYNSPSLREFTFDFLFVPRTQAESTAVQYIIHLFKFHAAPELLGEGVGRYFIPPSEFDIEFSVVTMGKISTCVLVDIALDYAASGQAAFYNDDRPVATRMTLRFRELEFITKELVERLY